MRWLTIIFLFGANLAIGQTFYPVPAPLLEKTVAPEQATECYIFFENPSGDTLRLRWKRVEASFPPAWTIDLCDYGSCYVGIPASGLMNPVRDTIRPYLKLIVQPGTTPGAGWLWFRVWEDGHPDNKTDVYFSLHTPGVTAASDAETPDVKAYPNPFADQLILENPTQQGVPAQIYRSDGVLIWQEALLPNNSSTISTTTWPRGLYALQIAGKTHFLIH